MKKKLLILFILILLFTGFIAVRFFILSQESGFGKLKIQSSPLTTVFLNNVASGKTPYEEKLKENDYILKLIPEGTATDTASWQGKVKITKNTLTYVNRELGSTDLTSAGVILTTGRMNTKPKDPNTGEIQVETEPAGAIVYLDNDEKGIAPLLLQDVPKGDHELSIYSPGFFRRTEKINVDAGFRVGSQFKLAMDESQQKVEDIQKAASPSATLSKKTTVTVNDTPTGFLRVREEPTVAASEAARVKPDDTFELLEEQAGWYKIEYEKGEFGWISGQYASKKED